jgi:hypothetical protein
MDTAALQNTSPSTRSVSVSVVKLNAWNIVLDSMASKVSAVVTFGGYKIRTFAQKLNGFRALWDLETDNICYFSVSEFKRARMVVQLIAEDATNPSQSSVIGTALSIDIDTIFSAEPGRFVEINCDVCDSKTKKRTGSMIVTLNKFPLAY